MADQITMETFADLEDREFIVDVDDSHSVGMELIEINEAGDGDGSGRTPFSLIFRGPDEPVYPQKIYRFEHEEIGVHDIFIVPIGSDKEGVRYEAVFN